MNVLRHIPLFLSIVLLLTGPAHGQRMALDEPLKVITHTVKGERVAGEMTAYDKDGFELRKANGEVTRVEWDRLDSRNIYLLHMRAFKDGAKARQWMELGRRRLAIEDGRIWAKRAMLRARRLDPSLHEAIEEAIEAGAPSPRTADGSPGSESQEDEKDAAGSVGASAPSSPAAWPTLSQERQDEAVAGLKAFAESAREKVNENLRLYETEYFLFSTDLPPGEARKWQRLLDKMYARLLETFALPEDRNIWRGKALVFVFQEPEDYRKYERVMEQTDPSWSAGMCHGKANGEVHIAFYRQKGELRFAQTLVHESVHGFVHRYRSRRPLPSWVNEGLAEWISFELAPQPARARGHRSALRGKLREHGGLGGMFDARRIEPWQYSIAYMLTDFMISRSRTGYVAFINGIKDGLNWRESLKEQYGAPLERLVPAFGAAVGAPGLRPDRADP